MYCFQTIKMKEGIPKNTALVLIMVTIIFTIVSTLSILSFLYIAPSAEGPMVESASGARISLNVEHQPKTEFQSNGYVSLEVAKNGG